MNGLKSDVNSLIEVNRHPLKTDSTSKTNVWRHFSLNVRSFNLLLTDLTKDSHTPPIHGLAGEGEGGGEGGGVENPFYILL